MNTDLIKLSRVRTNAENPRTISKPKFQKLIDSILAFPAMLEIRPVVIDGKMSALGGNMRLNALKEIARMPIEQLSERLSRLPEYQNGSKQEREKLVNYWGEWLDNPTVHVVNAQNLTEHERKQFMIKDNVSYGNWDYDALANKWPSEKLEAWGMDVWTGNPVEFAPNPGLDSVVHTDDGDPGTQSPEVDVEVDGVDPLAGLQDALPPELQGLELTPDHLENIKGDDETPNEHIIITYSPEERGALAALFGVAEEQLFTKICWRFDELQEIMVEEEEER